jgi:hypothetical protein
LIPPRCLDLLRTRKEKVGFSNSPTTLDSDESIIPIDLIHQETPDRHRRVRHQEIVDPKEGGEQFIYVDYWLDFRYIFFHIFPK